MGEPEKVDIGEQSIEAPELMRVTTGASLDDPGSSIDEKQDERTPHVPVLTYDKAPWLIYFLYFSS